MGVIEKYENLDIIKILNLRLNNMKEIKIMSTNYHTILYTPFTRESLFYKLSDV